MIKIHVKQINSSLAIKKELYNSDNRIPFSVTIGEHMVYPETIYSRNIYEENFIEFRFDKEDNALFEISMVGIKEEGVKEISAFGTIEGDNTKCYICRLVEQDSIIDNNLESQIFRSDNTVCLVLDKATRSELTYFHLGGDVYVGADKDMFLKAVCLGGLSPDEVFEIFGF